MTDAEIEAEILQRIDTMDATATGPDHAIVYDRRWLAIARTQIELGFLALRRAADPTAQLPDDGE